ncbi:ABC transporter substrate-binding protein [Candidatus Marinamargulisbacteria bacterium SCGC AAA071-K20]|nr:ABC transporter substrate-binding protein [Candidatus Marinamargulisbacteria bacterium SCGC AAA071-K20]
MFFRLFLILIFLGSLAFSKPPIKVGMSLALSGASQELGKAMFRSSKAYFEHINKKGGINGQQIEIVAYDDYYDPHSCVRNTIMLVENDKVDLLYGYVGTPTVTRILPLLKHYQENDMYLFFPFTGAGPQRKPPYGKYVYNLRASYVQETKGLVDHFLSIGRKRVAVYFQSDGYGKTGWVGVNKGLESHGVSIVSEAAYKRGTPYSNSFKRQVDLILEGKPDAVVCIGSYQACAGFIRDLRNAGSDILAANISFVGTNSLLGLLSKESKNSDIDYTKNLVNSMTVPIKDNSIKATKDYYWLMGYETEDQFNAIEFEGFLNARLLVTILKNMDGDFKRSEIPKAAAKVTRFNLGIDTPITISQDNHQALNEIYYISVQDGQFSTVKDWSVWQK